MKHTATRPTHLAEIVRHKPTHMGFCDTSGIGDGGVWLDLLCSGKYLVWRHLWPSEIVANLVLSTNREGIITNYDLELSILIFHEATLLVAVPDTVLTAPLSWSDNTLAVSRIMK